MADNNFNMLLQALFEQTSLTNALKTARDYFKVNPIKLQIDTSEIQSQLSNVSKSLSGLNTKAGSGDVFSTTTEKVKKTNKEVEKLATLQQKLTTANQIKIFSDSNTKMAKNIKIQLDTMFNALINGSNISETELKDIRAEFTKLKVDIRQAGDMGKSFGDKIGEGIRKFGDWTLASGILMRAVNAARQMKDAVYEIDTAMTNLYKVTNETSTKYEQFLDNSTEKAQRLGRSLSSIIEQSANWAKLGYSIDESSDLAELSSIYANVAEVDDNTAVSDMVTAMKAFNIEAKNAVTIIDPLNKLGNEFATSAGDLGEGLQKSASAMATAGTDMYKTLAMITGGAEITQDAGEFGNFLKVGSMRIRGMKGELEELGEEVDDSIESVSKVQTQILNLTNGKVNIFDSNNQFRDYYDIMNDVSKVYDKLSSINQADLMETLFGKQRGNQGAALIQAFQSSQIQKAYEAATKSAGSAYEEQARWLDSLDAKTQQFEAAFQSLSNTVLDSDFLKGLVDSGTGFVNILDVILGKFGTLNSLIGGFGSYFMGKKGLD